MASEYRSCFIRALAWSTNPWSSGQEVEVAGGVAVRTPVNVREGLGVSVHFMGSRNSAEGPGTVDKAAGCVTAHAITNNIQTNNHLRVGNFSSLRIELRGRFEDMLKIIRDSTWNFL